MPTGAIFNSRMSLPITEKQWTTGGTAYSAHPAFYIATYIFFSNLTILFNKWLIDTAGFPYPIFLTCWHMTFSAISTQILARTTRMLDGRKDVEMTGRTYMRAIMPIGLLYSGSLVCSNLTYLYLSVPFIQMLKSVSPVAVLFTSWIWGVASPSWSVLFKVLVIVFGVALASFGEIHFQWMGFWYQITGIAFESVRLVMTQVLLSGDGQKMDPLVSLYYYAPVCAVMNFLLVWYTEMETFKMDDFVRVGPVVLVINASVAFMLNIASLFLIGKTSSLVMTLTGIFKSILLVVAGVLVWGTPIGALQLLGYIVALFGFWFYSVPLETMQEFVAETRKGLVTISASPS
ncbi:triose-phosphate transporter [Diaporthe amygdali]|uniref:triose-phosphate transporter n=1 Tax=Phomopsis amygdali TaxID=1214568 RepID=UPI0022FE404D|nr:triose-phosphate transporter [Diaporthe amygdali]KAJ0117748.1 triose-phosphate transporter [Diaporthe amygdali]